MKRILVLLLACMLVFSIMVSVTSCINRNTPDDNTPDDTPSGDTQDELGNGPEGSDGIQLPVIPLDPSAPETEEDGENTEG